MKVLKFGGTSLGSAERIEMVAGLVRGNTDCIVVCSAMSGMTNNLLEVTKLWEQGLGEDATRKLREMEAAFNIHADALLPFPQGRELTQPLFDEVFSLLLTSYDATLRGHIPVLGEQLSSRLLQQFLVHTGTPAVLLDATGFVRLDENNEPNAEDISRRILQDPLYKGQGVYVTQGFICRNHLGELATLSRGGSDFTATLLGAAVSAELIEIWTDIDGMHNNDPRHVSGTMPIRELSYTEAAELAYFGAKILHPSCVRPAREKCIPICIKNTFDPNAPGTTIQAETPAQGIRAIAAKDQISILRITSGRMFNAFGFLAKVFEVFRNHRIPVDVVTTSEVSVSVTIEDTTGIEGLMEDLKELGRVNLETDRCIICVVGDVLQPGHIASIFQLLKAFDIRMISLGASSNNITLVLPKEQKQDALKAIHPIFSNHTIKELSSCTTINN